MRTKTSILRIVPNNYANNREASKKFYTKFLDMKWVMDMIWGLIFASNKNKQAQITMIQNTENKLRDNKPILLPIKVKHSEY
ncbi:hypothetical protein [uncultured Marixanthomonas sp.]|uniref:hypothetical protein n=1 Tax=uncultured Marixanthomonas sp. TaxID=757245 RepID=UPI0030DC726A